jgi:hypothetical protein
MFSAAYCHGPGMSYWWECSNDPVSAMCWDQDRAYDWRTPTCARAGTPTDALRLLTSDTSWDSAEASYPPACCGSVVVVVVVGAGTVVVVITGGTVVVVVTWDFTVAAVGGDVVEVVDGAFVVVVAAGVVVVVVGATVVDVVVDVAATGTTVVEVVVVMVVVDDVVGDAATTSGACPDSVILEAPGAGMTRTAERIATNATRTRDNDRSFMRALARGK